MVIIDKDTKDKYTIDPDPSRRLVRLICPKCSHTRKKSRDKILAWNNQESVGFCHNCQTSFYMEKPYEYKSVENRDYKRPVWENNTDISDRVVKWFEERKISQFTLRHMKVTDSIEWMPQKEGKGKDVGVICFNYFRDGELVNVKYRDRNKNFKFYKDAELILYNIDNIVGKDEIIIVEGEIDALSCYEIGLHHVVSVPNGANTGRINFEYLDTAIDLFENAKKIIVATDNDKPGISLRTQLAARFGIEKCFKVDFEDVKDANEYLIKYGREKLENVFKNAVPFPIDGVFNVNNFKAELENLWEFGLQPGLKIDIPEFDKLISFEFGRVYTVTGIPGHGKSEFLDFVIERLNVLHGVKIAYFSPENHPLQLHASKIIEKLTGVRFSKKYLDPKTFESACEYMKDNFYFIEPPDNYQVDEILTRARALIFQKGVKILVLDPYNKFEHQHENGESETNYISKFMDKMTTFAKKNNIILFLVAHPRKMNKNAVGLHEIPTLYDINGSSNFYNKTDFGVTVYRNMNTGFTEVYVQKVKFKHLGEIGNVLFKWNKDNGRYDYFGGNDVHDILEDNTCHLENNNQEVYIDEMIDGEDMFTKREGETPF